MDRLGSGARYRKLISKLEKKGAKDPKALAAYIGRKKYGVNKFRSLAMAGLRRYLAGKKK